MTRTNTSEMTWGTKTRALRGSRAWTQEDLAAAAELGLATVQRVERGLPAAPGTIASLAAAFDLDASELVGEGGVPDEQPYVPLAPVRTGRQLEVLPGGVDSLDFGYGEIDDLAQAELIEELEGFCALAGMARAPTGAVEQVRREAAARALLARLTDADLAVTGGGYLLNCAEVDVDMGAGVPILMAQWTSERAIVRVAASATPISRAYIMGGLGRYESPADGVVWLQRDESAGGTAPMPAAMFDGERNAD